MMGREVAWLNNNWEEATSKASEPTHHWLGRICPFLPCYTITTTTTTTATTTTTTTTTLVLKQPDLFLSRIQKADIGLNFENVSFVFRIGPIISSFRGGKNEVDPTIAAAAAAAAAAVV